MFPLPGGRNNLTSPITTACLLPFSLQRLVPLTYTSLLCLSLIYIPANIKPFAITFVTYSGITIYALLRTSS